MRKSKKALDFISSSFEKKDECNECKYYYLCRGGGCKRNNASFNYCETYKKFFNAPPKYGDLPLPEAARAPLRL